MPLSIKNTILPALLLEASNGMLKHDTRNYIFRLYHLAGRQHKITGNDLLVVNSLEAEIGSQIFLNKVMIRLESVLLSNYGHILVRKSMRYYCLCVRVRE